MEAESLTRLDIPLKLARLPISLLHRQMHAVVGAIRLAARSRSDFFSLTTNDLEISIVADGDLVDRVLGGSEDFELSEETWNVIVAESHSDDFDASGMRVKEIATPLSNAGISILFISSYASDFLLCKSRRWESVAEILHLESGFSAAEPAQLQRAGSSAGRSDQSFSPSREGSLGGSVTLTRSLSTALAGSPHSSPSRALRSRTDEVSPTSAQPESLLSRQLSQHRAIPHSATHESEGSSDTGLESSSGRASSPTPGTPPDEEWHAVRKGLGAIGMERAETTQDYGPRSWPKDDSAPINAHNVVPVKILDDALVCVGLDMTRELEWRTKLEDLLFYSHEFLGHGSQRGRTPVRAESRRGSEDDLFGQTPVAPTSIALPPQLDRAPSPFISFTRTSDAASLTADVQLLRRLFSSPDGEVDESEGIVLAVGDGGLRGQWNGESEGEEDAQSTPNLSASPRSRPAALPRLDSFSSHRSTVDSGRRLLKCLQLDLTEKDIDHVGSVSAIADALISEDINLLYGSTMRTANILVVRPRALNLADIRRAKLISVRIIVMSASLTHAAKAKAVLEGVALQL